jgi:hypothetical protein
MNFCFFLFSNDVVFGELGSMCASSILKSRVLVKQKVGFLKANITHCVDWQLERGCGALGWRGCSWVYTAGSKQR